MPENRLGLMLLLAAGAALGTVAVLAREQSYAVPREARPDSIPFELSSEVPAGHVVRAFEVEGICCQGCSSKLHGALMALDGVREAAVNPREKEVAVLVREDVSIERLAAVLTFDKYSVRER